MSRCVTTFAGPVTLVLLSLASPRLVTAADPGRGGPSRASEAPTADLTRITEDGNRFALDLYAQLRQRDGNLFFSPSSISLALAMAHAGAEGATQKQMAKTLHFELSQPQLDQAMQALLAQWESTDPKQGYRLRVANRLWGAKSYEFLPKFLDTTRTGYGAELARLDFAQDTEGARRTINEWVEQQTEAKIVDLIPAGALTRDSALVLTNAVYFLGDWTAPFTKELTQDEDFHGRTGQAVKTPLMHQEAKFRYAAVDGLQVLELPYGNRHLSMVVLLPDEIAGIADLEARLSHDKVREWTTNLRSQEVVVYLPRFTTTASFELSSTLATMGMPSAFDPSKADFSGMTGKQDLFISKVVHKAFVDVNEKGTEAAAATGVIMAPTAMPIKRPKPVFRADHPFVFLIRDNRNGAFLFLGRLMDPGK